MLASPPGHFRVPHSTSRIDFRADLVDHLGLEPTGDALGQGIAADAPDGSDRRIDPGLSLPLGAAAADRQANGCIRREGPIFASTPQDIPDLARAAALAVVRPGRVDPDPDRATDLARADARSGLRAMPRRS